MYQKSPSYSSAMDCKQAIATISLGQPKLHDIRTKLYEIAGCGIKAIELFYDDLETLACTISQESSQPSSRESCLKAAEVIRDLCHELQLTVLNLQPFRFYEGLLDRQETDRLQSEVLPLWIEILQILGADTILVASNFLGPDPQTGQPRTTGDIRVIVDDLRVMAVKGLACSPPVRIAYEALAWGDHVKTWEKAWEIVQKVDLPNFGLVLDTFNLAAIAYADPATENGRLYNDEKLAAFHLRSSLEKMLSDIDMSRVFVVQIADAERLCSPLQEGHPFYVAGQPSRMSWSRNARLFLCESDRGGYLPVLDIVHILIKLGWTGHLSHEVFSRTLSDAAPETPLNHAARASRSWNAMLAALMQKDELEYKGGYHEKETVLSPEIGFRVELEL
ncbi:putative 4-hydroxyphenylpyruvate dioxygenase [Stachybotrys elegans]|uniref:4-hydroxyphenylpyruvate dioxygenase n=1 Tax=Stachybotrys elegans TaxID=80388 RepID=A0A8K0T2T0_9HYPO|nr:putative 4-hydroxyphenylpyruvate dioxygenase [Stachybotrys elegans]